MLDKKDKHDVERYVNKLINGQRVKCVTCDSPSVKLLKINENGPSHGTGNESKIRAYFQCEQCGSVFSQRAGDDVLGTLLEK